MERLRKEGKAPCMKWFASLGNQSKWTKHKFDPYVLSEINTSNFVESFNSTLGEDRCRPLLTLLEGTYIDYGMTVLHCSSMKHKYATNYFHCPNTGIRRVCVVKIAARQQQAENWDEEGICPNILKLVKDTKEATEFCKSHMSSPGEFEIHEGKSQFPLNLNKKCACGAWKLTGIPCRHVMRAMIASKQDPHMYVSNWYSVKSTKKHMLTTLHQYLTRIKGQPLKSC
ncbi:hypothetical protein RDABS01_024898 [Bienertia sinuspersici]